MQSIWSPEYREAWQSAYNERRQQRAEAMKQEGRQRVGVTDERMTAETDASVRERARHPLTVGDHIDLAKQHLVTAVIGPMGAISAPREVDGLLNQALALLDDAQVRLERQARSDA